VRVVVVEPVLDRPPAQQGFVDFARRELSPRVQSTDGV